MGWSAFRPTGQTVTVAVTTGASTGVQAPGSPGEPADVNYRIMNSTSQLVFLGFGSTALNASAAATVATGLPLLPNSAETFTFGANTFFSTIAPTGTSTVYITPGDGL